MTPGGGRKRKRQRVSWAEGELLEEVKLFHMAKPVNPSIPPPVVDDAEEDDASSQPGLALLGLLGVESPSQSGSASSSPSATPSPPTLVSSSTASHAPLGGTAATSAQKPPEGQDGGVGGTRVGNSNNSSTGDGAGSEGVETSRATGGSKLFKGFEKTETVVRRKKQVAQPPPPPGAPPPLPSPDEAAHLTHRYPKDIWPGHKPLHSHVVGVGDADEDGGKDGGGEQFEFFCDGCDETIASGVERMECAVCPDEFCLCHSCYDEGEVLDKRHKHELIPSAAPLHVTRAATSVEAAREAARALHDAEAQPAEGVYDADDLG